MILGLALKAGSGAGIPPMAGVHALGVGGLGTMTTVMMLRTIATREPGRRAGPRWVGSVVALIGIAAVLRILAAFTGVADWMIGAAGVWTLALLSALGLTLHAILSNNPVRAH